jgi:2-polyprenyl-6-methoxyphenol hydroxylase-like FAD-dependent oxidoreductase
MLGLLLARAGVQVTVLEKHGDFLRDFRGDTVHASTLTVLDELGLGEEFSALPTVRYIESLTAQLDAGEVPVADLRWLSVRDQHIALGRNGTSSVFSPRLDDASRRTTWS